MKKTLAFIIAALALTLSAKADYEKLVITKVDDSTVKFTHSNIIDKVLDTFEFTVNGVTYIIPLGAHRTVPYGPFNIGATTKVGGGGSGGGGGKNYEAPSGGGSVVVIITDTATGAWGSYNVNVPFATGWVAVQYSGGQYSVASYSVTASGFVFTSDGKVSPIKNLFWKSKA